MRFVLLILALYSTLFNAFAFENLPEFSWIDETEATNDFTRPNGSEFTSDYLTYMKPEAWEYEWLTHDVATDITVGSIDSIHFMNDNRARLKKRLIDEFEFRFTYLDDSHFEKDVTRHVFETILWPTQRFGVGGYMDPSYVKKDDDTGLALFYKPVDRAEIRLFHTFVDPSRNNRNDKSDRIVDGKYGSSSGFTARTTTDEPGEFYEAAFRYEPRMVWNFQHDNNNQYQFDRTFASLWMRKRRTPNSFISARTQYDRKMESKSKDNESWTVSRYLGLFRSQWMGLGANQDREMTAGIMASHKRYDTTYGKMVTYDLVPHLWYRIPSVIKPKFKSHFNIGLDITVHLQEGETSLDRTKTARSITEERANLSYEFEFDKQSDLRIIATIDLDKLGTNDTWEGGNMQFQLHF